MSKLFALEEKNASDGTWEKMQRLQSDKSLKRLAQTFLCYGAKSAFFTAEADNKMPTRLLKFGTRKAPVIYTQLIKERDEPPVQKRRKKKKNQRPLTTVHENTPTGTEVPGTEALISKLPGPKTPLSTCRWLRNATAWACVNAHTLMTDPHMTADGFPPYVTLYLQWVDEEISQRLAKCKIWWSDSPEPSRGTDGHLSTINGWNSCVRVVNATLYTLAVVPLPEYPIKEPLRCHEHIIKYGDTNCATMINEKHETKKDVSGVVVDAIALHYWVRSKHVHTFLPVLCSERFLLFMYAVVSSLVSPIGRLVKVSMRYHYKVEIITNSKYWPWSAGWDCKGRRSRNGDE